MRERVGAITMACVTAGALAAAGGAAASFPGSNGMIGYSYDPPPDGGPTGIAAIAPDGSSRVDLTTAGDGFEYSPSYSADGERIAFIHTEPGNSDGQVWVMNADGSAQTQLTAGTEDAADLSPEFSPDGRQIVFDRYNGVADTEIWIMNADGSGQTQLTDTPESSRDPSFSPDGSRIVFTRNSPIRMATEVWVMNADGSNEERLTTGVSSSFASTPSFSPDGQRIVFGYGDGATFDIYVMNADGSELAPLAPTPSLEAGPSFAPDGTRIVFERLSSAEDLVLVDPDGANPTPIPGSEGVYGESPTTWQPLNPPSCEMTGAPKQKTVKQVEVAVTCSNENVSAVIEGSGSAPRVRGAIASKKKKFTIPAVTAQVPAGTPTTITVPLPKKGRKALKKATKAGKKGRATLTAVLTDDFGETSNDAFEVKFKGKKK
jgi:WD40-like Beta Propeller Repeat